VINKPRTTSKEFLGMKMTRSLQRPVSVEGDVFTDAGDHESTKQGNLRLGLNRSIKGKERADEIGEEVMIG
jgi:hypothetical protein